MRAYQSVGSAIYVEDGLAVGQVYEIRDNRFEGNVALRGAAMHLKMTAATLTMNNNTFTRNQAYFEGNAVLIEGSEITATI